MKVESIRPELTPLERKVIKIQHEIIDAPSKIDAVVYHPVISQYAAELAKKYFPRAKNDAYLNTATKLFQIDLATAPYLHQKAWRWRYNYNELDVTANFLKFSNSTHRYFHLEAARLDRPTPDDFRTGCDLLRLKLHPLTDELFDSYQLTGTRSRVAARLIETISYTQHDREMNQLYDYDSDPSKRNLRAARGDGRFRYLRRGRDYLILGTKGNNRTTDIRHGRTEVFDYAVSHQDAPIITLKPDRIAQIKADLQAILDRHGNLFLKWKRADDYYRHTHEKFRFTNSTPWSAIDKWLRNRIHKTLKAYPKTEFDLRNIYHAAKHPFPISHLTKRTNFFWRPEEELHTAYASIWRPYNWDEPSS